MNPPRHQLEVAVDDLAHLVLDEDNPDAMAIWAVAALGHRLDLPVLVGEDAVIFDLMSDDPLDGVQSLIVALAEAVTDSSPADEREPRCGERRRRGLRACGRRPSGGGTSVVALGGQDDRVEEVSRRELGVLPPLMGR